ncbi:hypothetical protein KCV04_g12652, partial [Aureobasidium melanogenum]
MVVLVESTSAILWRAHDNVAEPYIVLCSRRAATKTDHQAGLDAGKAVKHILHHTCGEGLPVLTIGQNRDNDVVTGHRPQDMIVAVVGGNMARICEQDNPTISQRLTDLRTFSTTNLNVLNDDKLGHKSPDASIGYPDQVYPQIVFKTSYSQARKALKSLAWSYIMGSSHSIRCVVGLDLEYPRKRPRLLLMLMIMDVKQEITDESLGEHNPDYEIAALCIRDLLEDEMLKFTPPAITE